MNVHNLPHTLSLVFILMGGNNLISILVTGKQMPSNLTEMCAYNMVIDMEVTLFTLNYCTHCVIFILKRNDSNRRDIFSLCNCPIF